MIAHSNIHIISLSFHILIFCVIFLIMLIKIVKVDISVISFLFHRNGKIFQPPATQAHKCV